MASYAMKKVLKLGFEDALARAPDALKAEGFGVLTEIDVKETLHKKLGADFRKYRILGACNPPFALQALQAEIDIGLMLPCNLVVYDAGDGTTVVAAIDPEMTVAATGNPKLLPIALEIRRRLARVLESL